MKLGKKRGNKFSKFARQLAKEDPNIVAGKGRKARREADDDKEMVADDTDYGDVHSAIVEKLKIVCNQDGSCESLEVKGSMSLTAHTSKGQLVCVKMGGFDNKDFRMQPNPNINRKAWAQGIVAPKSDERPFPLKKGVPVLRWRMEKRGDTDYLPLTINAWPEAGRKSTNVNIEYTLERKDMTLHNLVISVPLGTSEAPEIVSVDGSTNHVRKEELLEWIIDVVDAKNGTGTLEFEIPQVDETAFFPMAVSFESNETMVGINVESATAGSEPLKTSSSTSLSVVSFQVGDSE